MSDTSEERAQQRQLNQIQREAPPVPDPTVLTTEAIERALIANRDYVDSQLAVRDERLRGMDEATKVLQETVTRVPTDVQLAVGHLKELHNEKFASVEIQFKERDTRSERESRDNKVAVDAAFAAQKEAASEQNKSNTLAIDKSEKATAETLNKQADLFKSTTDAISVRVDELKGRLDRDEGSSFGIAQVSTDSRLSAGLNVNIVMAVLTGISTIITIGAVLFAIFKP